MKHESVLGSPIEFELWETPVIQSNQLWLLKQLFTGTSIYFFFKRNYDSSPDEYHVLKIDSYDPFRITEESVGDHKILDFVTRKDSKTSAGRTFKVWNSQFAIDSYNGLGRPIKEFEKMEKSEYIISTNDFWIQFVSFCEPEWTFHQKIKINDLVIQYLNKDSSDD